MTVITISIVESPIQKVANIPQNVTLSTNVPSTIFYTLDGTDPDTDSLIAVGSITLPTDQGGVTLKIFATNGVDSTPITTYQYGPDWTKNRLPHAKVTGVQELPSNVFGSLGQPTTYQYSQPAGITVDAIDGYHYNDQFDGTATGTYADQTNLPYTRQNYHTVYSTSDKEGVEGNGIGNMPSHVKFIVPKPIAQSSDANSKLFNAKSMVIVQDGRNPPEDPNVTMVNKQYFSNADLSKVIDGQHYYTMAREAGPPTGSLVRTAHNPRDNTYTFYYRDRETNSWIISIEPMSQTRTIPAMQQLCTPSSRDRESRNVYQWIPFKGSRLI
jgi:hypothetical protein